MFTSAYDIKTLADARAYLKRRAKDAVACYREREYADPIALAVYLARYW